MKTKLIKKGAKAPTTEETSSVHIRSVPDKTITAIREIAFRTEQTHGEILVNAIKLYKKELKIK